ncbi:YdcF family protein [Faecalicoccus pleomorphus]|nr:YdcF family protein [Faecalicoccus pleomorphus]MDB7983701.1 YdcF family protein [Faecalicoccus pleomorphus]
MIVKMLLVLFILFVVCLLLVYLHYFPAIPRRKENYPYALLLGCPSHNDGSYATSQIRRCELAMEAYKKGYFDTLIISGGAVKNQYVESLQMEKYILKRIAMPIVCETKARNTWENFQFTKEKIGDVPVLILSSGTHIRRACAIGKSFF